MKSHVAGICMASGILVGGLPLGCGSTDYATLELLSPEPEAPTGGAAGTATVTRVGTGGSSGVDVSAAGTSAGLVAGTGGEPPQPDPAEVECALPCAGDTAVCDTSSGECVECLASSDCDEEYCDLATRRCVECLSDVHCEGTSVCDLVTHECATPCSSSAVCGDETPFCHPDRFLCVECLTDGDCDGDICLPATAECEECVDCEGSESELDG